MADEFEEDYETYAGTRLFVKGGRPTANTEAAFETYFGTGALEVTITSVGVYNGLTYNTASISVVSTGRDAEQKGSYTFGQSEFPVVWLPDQEGQILLRDYSEGENKYNRISVAVVDQAGGVSYFTAQVMAFQDAGGGNNDVRNGTMTLLRQSNTIVAATPVVPEEDA